MRLIPTSIHAILDYALGVGLIMLPLMFARDGHPAAVWVPVALGVGALAYSLMTDYEGGLLGRRIPMPTHLILDVAAGSLLAVSPFLFGFYDAQTVWPYVGTGVFEILSAAMTKSPQGSRRAIAGDTTAPA